MRYTGEEPTPAKVGSIVRRLYFVPGAPWHVPTYVQVYLYAMFRGNVIAGRPQLTSAASYGTRRHLGGYGTYRPGLRRAIIHAHQGVGLHR
jgi:hypothetical protein